MKLEVGRGAEVGMTTYRHSNQAIFLHMGLSALFSLIAAFVLSVEAWELAKDPTATFACDVNAILSCGTVAQSWQATVAGFPNAFVGLMCEPVVVTIAVAGFSGVVFKRWFMFTAQLVYLCGITFAYWLFYQSVTDIGALCPWCLVITVSTTFVFFSLLHYNIRENNLYLPPKLQAAAETFVRVRGDILVATLLLLVIVATIFVNYGTMLFAW